MDKKKEKQSVLQLLFGFMDRANGDHVGAYAAQAALFIIMSAIPFLLVFLSLLRFTPVSESTVLSVIQMVVPGQIKITPMLINIVDEVYTNSAKVLPIAVIFAIYSAVFPDYVFYSVYSVSHDYNSIYTFNIQYGQRNHPGICAPQYTEFCAYHCIRSIWQKHGGSSDFCYHGIVVCRKSHAIPYERTE